ncbi:MAG: rod shape-determining protein [Candidatus Buchananbacteria bacterium CG10_big_fil_rev_8_21_14_0_10_42_9]|uniref:Cell shape-determining protein MreB n=1 Tax=Candidatus Buchananbacteria bacterium CG10_big_fil_rev_8_21_14_0_10_42_9 TaxID=1974526 RepID=A0A2H0W2D6_9BACT|nr:MAG: rod shape-determining protein [Candidatus Buchananbacteria bacterium CG10_big_fil_rev_8_21_14_0_10_42_9]
MFGRLFKTLSKDIAIDLGTSHTLIFVADKGVVVNEASIVAVNTKTDQILSVGEEAARMVGKVPPHIIISKPLVDGVISDFEITEKMLKYFMDKINRQQFGFFGRPRVVVGIPLDVTEVEKKAVEDSVVSAGAKDVYMVENIIANAIGARLPIQDASGNMIVCIGGGLTEIAVISLSGVVAWKSIRMAGEDMNQDIVNFARNEFKIIIGERVAEQAKIDLSRATEAESPMSSHELKLQGRDLVSGLPKEITVSGQQILQTLERSVKTIIDNIKDTLELTPPELIADIYKRGIVLTGGGSLLNGLSEAIMKATKIPVKVIEDPTTCGVRGMGIILSDESLLKEVTIPSSSKEDGFIR